VKDGAKLGEDGETEQSSGKGEPAKAAWVSRVMPSSPADKAGVRVGDVITQIDSQKIQAAADVVDYVSSQKVGSKVTLAYLRDGKQGKVQVTLGELPENPYAAGQDVQKDKIGLNLQTLTPEMSSYLGLGRDAKGAVVTEVEPQSRAAKAGLRPEDVIVEVDRKPVASAEEAVGALRAAGKAGHMLKIRRAGAPLFITVPAK